MTVTKRILAGILLFATLFSFAACDGKEKVTGTQEAEENGEEQNAAPYSYDLSQYIQMGEIVGVTADFEDPTVCTEEELDAQVFQILLANATFAPKGGAVERYNKVEIDFSVIFEGNVLEKYSQSQYGIVIGLDRGEAIETLLGEELIGSRIGEERRIQYTYPTEVIATELSGKTVTLSAVVKNIYQQTIPVLIDDFVKNLDGYELETVWEFRQSVRADILKEKEERKEQAVWLKLVADAKILGYPEKELQAYTETYCEYYKGMAESFEIPFEDFLEVYMETDKESFEKEAVEVAKEKVKNEMILTQLVRLQNVSLSETEYSEGVKAYYESEKDNFESLDAYVAQYTKENIERNLLWDKALRLVIANAVPLGT